MRKITLIDKFWDKQVEYEVPNKEKVIIGRSHKHGSDIVISKDSTTVSSYITISRKHCVLYINDEDVSVSDLGTRGGTYVNGEMLLERQKRVLEDGDKLRLGKGKELIVKIEGAENEGSEGYEISDEEVKVKG